MRPVRLEVEGFTCYRDRQTPLVFDGLSLFAIAGPTGAGKSSILDAILFALYGQVPRIGKQGFADFISQGRDVLSVTLDFTIRGTTYRVARRAKRTKSGLNTTAILEQIAPSARPLKEQVKPVTEEIARLLGLDFEAFTQTVILPQGDFAKFLKADPKDQRGILQHLLRHEIYERMRKEAERRRSESDQTVRVLERALAGSEHATPEALDAAREALRARTVEHAALEQAKAAREAVVTRLRAGRQLTVDVETLRGRRLTLESKVPAVDAKRAELAAARSAASVVPRVDAARDAQRRRDAATREEADARDAVAATRSAVTSAAERLAAAAAASGQVATLNQRIRALDEIKGDLARRDAVRASIAERSQVLPKVRARAADAAASLARALAAKEQAAAARAEAQTQLAASPFEPTDERRLQEVWETAVHLRSVLADEASLAERVRESAARGAAAAGAAARADKAVQLATRDAETAATVEQAAAAAREAGRTRHQAASVREHLHPGEACPVCLQTVVLMPPLDRVPELDALDAALDQATEQLALARRAQQSAAETRASTQASLEAATHAHDALVSSAEEKAQQRAVAVATIAAGMAWAAPMLDPADARTLIDAVEAQRGAIRQARQLHDAAAAALQQAEKAKGAADLLFAQVESDARAASDALDRMVSELERLSAELSGLTARIAAVSTHEHPAAERDDLARRVGALEAAWRTADAALASARTTEASAVARSVGAAEALARATETSAASVAALREALADGGFPSVDAVTAAVRPPATQSAIDGEIRRHDADMTAVTTRLLELEPQLGGGAVSADTLETAEADCQATVRQWEAARLDVATLGASIERLAAEAERRQVDQRALATATGSRDLLTGMASDLKGDAFQEYLLEEAFRALVAGASVRMRQMSNRYTLDWRDGAFYVVDHDNAGEQRRAETLSGGETFMASLCLALQLSDEVLKTSGALQMDSLFIDEGFGTLDADSLTEVTDAMEALRQDGGRLIGVISHRPELTERLPGCIRVSKGAGESRWALERAG